MLVYIENYKKLFCYESRKLYIGVYLINLEIWNYNFLILFINVIFECTDEMNDMTAANMVKF